MSFHHNKSPIGHRFSRDGFLPLNRADSPRRDVTVDIPMERVSNPQGDTGYENNTREKSGLYNPGSDGFRRSMLLTSHGKRTGHKGYGGEEDAINKMGALYHRVLKFSIVTRYLVYYLPLAVILTIPIIVGATASKGAEIGGVRILWFFVWLECVWPDCGFRRFARARCQRYSNSSVGLSAPEQESMP